MSADRIASNWVAEAACPAEGLPMQWRPIGHGSYTCPCRAVYEPLDLVEFRFSGPM